MEEQIWKSLIFLSWVPKVGNRGVLWHAQGTGEEEQSWARGGLAMGVELVCPRHQFVSPV